jgi:transcriptional regulator with XRE-family HTH domain
MKKDEFCKKLKQARLESDLKQSEVAQALGLPASAISLIESGERKLDIFELYELAQIYKKDIKYFLEDNNSAKFRRWYDDDPAVTQAIELMRQASGADRKASAMGVIGFLQELNKQD